MIPPGPAIDFYSRRAPLLRQGATAAGIPPVPPSPLYHRQDLLIPNVPAAGLSIRIVRTYNGRTLVSGPLGRGWTHTYNVSCSNTKKALVVTDERGEKVEFAKQGKRILPAGDFSAARRDREGNYLFTRKSGLTYLFSAEGALRSIADRTGRRLSLGYSRKGDLATISDDFSRSVTVDYDAAGRIYRITDPLKRAVRYEYDEGGRLARVVDPEGGAIAYSYNADHLLETVRDARGYETAFHYNYNVLGDVCSVVDASGGVTTFDYDGRQKKVAAITDPLGHRTEFTYDERGNVTSLKDALGGVTRYEYDENGNGTAVIDAGGRRTSYAYDQRGRPAAETDAAGAVTRYRYDDNGNLLSTAKSSYEVLCAYDRHNRLIKAADSSGRSREYSYDETGNLVKITDAGGRSLSNIYDPQNRLVQVEFPNETTAEYGYDGAGNLTLLMYELVHDQYEYDNLNRLVRLHCVSIDQGVGYAYDKAGNRTAMTDPLGGETRYRYDGMNRLIEITDPAGRTTSFAYDAAGRRTMKTYPNGASALYRYDALNRIIEVVNKKSSGETLSVFSYGYDAVGNVREAAEADGKAATYAYDQLSRLIRTVRPDGRTLRYQYDPLGRLRSIRHDTGTVEYLYDERHRLIRVETGERTIAFEYDRNGNRTGKSDGRGKTAYAYDCQNRLIKIIYPDKSVNNYMYCPLQRRISKDDSSGVTMYFHDGSIHDGSRANIILEYDMDLSLKARYTCGLELGEILSRARGEETLFYHYDGMGNVTELTDLKQDVVARYRYDDQGERAVRTGTVDNQYGFAGHEYDGDPAFYYVGDYTPKYYDPAIGTYTSIGAFGLLEETRGSVLK